MLTKTMGSPLSFEYRREELSIIGGGCTDEDVANSYIGMGINMYTCSFLPMIKNVFTILNYIIFHRYNAADWALN